MYYSRLVFKIYFVLYYWLAQWPRLFHIFLKFQIWNEGGYVVFGTLCKHSYIYITLFVALIRMWDLRELLWLLLNPFACTEFILEFGFSHWQGYNSQIAVRVILRRLFPPLTADSSISSGQVRTLLLIIIINIKFN